MATAAMPQQDIAAIQTLSLDGLTLSMFAKAAQFERLSADQSYSAALLRHAADSLKRLERERASLAADMEAACLARDTTGILASPAEAIAMLDEENKRLQAELDAVRSRPEGEPA